MENFIVSARKYRPQNFSTVIGQAHITTTLKNAIQHQHLAHAFLFCGPRGVGKTTCARILAKTINCENQGADGEACNSCNSCVSFNDGISLNIHELDAASNNSVDDIRTLVEQVRFAPQAGKYKVYIIDEVHMLSSSAFNAFLKTLEEPPHYAIFILATTEKHKILPTILSRCQIFDFKRITTNDTVEHLEEICEKESIQAEKAALQVIAQKSEGCMRDALSILDKIVSFTNGELTYTNTLEHLNILDDDYYFKLIQCMLQQDVASALLLYDDINNKGFEGDLVLNGYSEFFRNLLVCKDAKVAALLEVVESFKDKYIATAKEVSVPYIIAALNVLNEVELNYKGARNKKLHVELALIKLCYLQQAMELVNEAGEVQKKKTVDSIKPLHFKNLPFVAVSEKETKQPAIKKETTKMEAPAALIIDSGIAAKEKVVPAATAVKETVVPKTNPVRLGKLDELSSIRDIYTAKNKNTTTVVAKPLELPSLKHHWQMIADKLRLEKNPAVQSFEMATLRISDNNQFIVVTPNNLQQKFIEQLKMYASAYLQEQFQNNALTFSVIVEANSFDIPQIETPLNSKEQYAKITEQFPLIRELKERLKLDLDY